MNHNASVNKMVCYVCGLERSRHPDYVGFKHTFISMQEAKEWALAENAQKTAAYLKALRKAEENARLVS